MRERIEKSIAAHREELIRLSTYVFEHPELGGEEFESAAYQEEYLRAKGFSLSHPLPDYPTAFVAEYGAGGKPVIAFASEYDALPGYGPNGGPGHACGHNWIAAVMCGCGVVLSELADELGISVRVVGCPAEENFGLKYNLCEAGVFDDIDLVLQAHLCERTSVSIDALALNEIDFIYHGRAAHGASYPEQGINALDAVVLLYNALGAMRRQLRDDARVGCIITNGGQAPNIIPDLASCRVEVRAKDKKYLKEIREKVEKAASGAALMTGATLETREFSNPYDDILHLPALMELCENCLREAGIEDIVPPEENAKPGSSDIGNVSHACPTLYAEFAPEGEKIFVHDESALELVNAPAAQRLMDKVICGFVLASVRYAKDSGLREAIKAEFEAGK